MTPAKAAILNDALAPLWRRLHTWVDAALQSHQHSRDQLTRDELLPLRARIFEIEALLRRLVLVAATAVTLDFQARWSPAAKTHAKSRARRTSKRIVRAARTFRLYTLRLSKTDRSLTTTVAVEAQTSDATHAHTHAARTTAHSDTLTSGPAKVHAPARARGNGPHDRAHIPTDDPDIPIEDVMRWFAAYVPDETTAEAIRRQEKEILSELERTGQPRKSAHPKGQKLERKTTPQLLDATQLQAYLAHLAQLAANPHAVIQRAAIAMARRREIAWRLSRIAAPKARGALAASIALSAVVIPFHNDFIEVMQLFALSHTEPDTT